MRKNILLLTLLSISVLSGISQIKTIQNRGTKTTVPQTKKSSQRIQRSTKNDALKNEIKLIDNEKSLSEEQKKQKIKSLIIEKKQRQRQQLQVHNRSLEKNPGEKP